MTKREQVIRTPWEVATIDKEDTARDKADLADAMIPPYVCSKIVRRRLLLKKLVADQVDDIPDSKVSSEIKARIFPSFFNLA